MRFNRRLATTCVGFGLAWLPMVAQGGVIYVDADATGANNGSGWADAYRELQSALAVAVANDEIWVAAGTYKPDYDVPSATHTGDRTATFQLISGVAIYGGFATGGGAWEDRDPAANATILSGDLNGDDGPNFANNAENSYHVVTGSGTDATAVIDGFRIKGGNADGSTPHHRGAGVYNDNGSPTIANNTITGNSASYGSGVLECRSSSPTIANNAITGNIGPGIYCWSSSPTIANNTITANSGGIYCSSSSPVIANCTITANNASSAAGVYVYGSSSSPTIANTIIAFNVSGIYRQSGSGNPVLRHNCVYGNTAYDYCGIPDPTGTDGNISTDPKLAGVQYGNLHIQPDSPCRDTGSNGDAYGEFDIDGQARIQPAGGTVDMGADESDGTVWPEGPYVIVRVGPDGDDDNNGSSWELAKRTVQAGVDAASAGGGEVWVQAGTYYERITLHRYAHMYGGFAGTETERDQRDWTANVSKLDGEHAGSVVTAAAGHAVSTIDGFTVTNGSGTVYGTGSDTYGGGIDCHSSAPTIANNTITGNSATVSGGGIYASGSATIANNTITGNSASEGGGIYCSSYSPMIANNTITGNSARSGGGIYCEGSSPTITNNTITGNDAKDGGGIWCWISSLTIANTIIAFNSSGIYRQSGSGSPVLSYNCVYGNTAYNYSDIADPTGTNGNISTDPKLAGVQYGNVHIQPDSPCKDTGSNSDAYGDFDIDGQARIQPGGGTVDIGADESDGTAWPAGPYVIVRVNPDGDDDHDGSSWELAKRTVQAGINAASAQGGEVWVQAGTYPERITLHLWAYVYGGFAGAETQRNERDWTAHVTTLDGQQGGSVVTARTGHAVSTIDGFTITNGSGTASGVYTYGGGIYCYCCSPTIANNTIMGNSAREGGGVYCESSATIAHNIVTANSASEGAGIFSCVWSPTIANNKITGNIASAYSSGGGICCYYSSPMIANNTIAGNSGPGIRCSNNSAPTITNNTITGNSASYYAGGGIQCNASSPTIANTIVAFNSSGIYKSGGSSSILTHNCVYGNTAYDYSGIPDPTGTDGNIAVDPLFVDKDGGNYRVAAGSPCIDAGRNADVPADTADLDGDGDTTEPMPFDVEGSPRFQDDPATPDCRYAPGTCGDAPIVNMGAYESYEYMLVAVAWRSVRTHGALGDLPIVLDKVASGSAVAREPRRFGVQRMEVDFNVEVSGLLTGTVVAEDLTHGGAIAATGQYTINGGMTLVIEFASGLPDMGCYRIDLTGNIAGPCGDADCEFRVLAGDINGNSPPYGDGVVDITDMAKAKANAVSRTPLTEDTCLFDVNIDGKIDLTDMALVKSLNGGAVTCP